NLKKVMTLLLFVVMKYLAMKHNVQFLTKNFVKILKLVETY
ncbi:hypothetical protein ACQPUS_01910, partial [Clostridium butyricum]